MKIPKLIIPALFATATIFGACKKSNIQPISGEQSPAVKLLAGVTPSKGLPRSVVTITGSNFSTDKTKLDVRFNGMAATVYTATATQLVVGVPQTASTGKITVTSDGVTSTSVANFTVTGATQSTWQKTGSLYAAVDPQGNIYTTYGGDVYKGNIATPGSLTIFSNSTTPLKYLRTIATGASGVVYVVEWQRNSIIKLSSTGAVSVLAGGGLAGHRDGQGTAAGFAGPNGIAVDAAGNIFVADYSTIRKIDLSGNVTTFAGSMQQGNVDGAGTTARFSELTGLAIDAAGNLFVADNKNKNIRKITPNGVVSTIAGSGRTGYDDGPAATAAFGYPQGLAVDAAGNIFVADYDYPLTSTIRMINTAGYVSTFLQGNTQAVANGPINASSTYFSDSVVFDVAGNMYISNLGVVSKVAFN
ncbi:NHL domain-containing protein [Mucilaginibacter myungsuensis]|uniref:IPT/TIG domain-containing protein n=1 Tax=Mucilaginibacter myungsuensis TaxID=649104 RepID=A0A929PVW7_9SPHI|nr:IPT/TIG domain-containing protein [Mucilaginibacter myungsuensis]MBE9661461.1 IPT/TIG domain-containing protein [Mucilaginibacter myungsuensis]MDN3597604.1 IPT/TIG domain-containing protein [Mucilaginibacter myungsuensis]